LPIGQEFDFKIIKMNEAQKRIGLSLRATSDEDERNRLQDYKRQAAVATSTVGDAMKQHKSDERNRDTRSRNTRHDEG
jgi:small subunit ribosomal protein S1